MVEGIPPRSRKLNQAYVDKCWIEQSETTGRMILAGIQRFLSFLGGQNGSDLIFRKVLNVVYRLHKAGVKFAVGTDADAGGLVPGPSMFREIEYLVKAGMSPMEALRAATTNGADLLNLPDVGRIAEGAKADLVLLESNPIADIRNIRKISSVIRDGVLISSEARRKGLKEIQSRAKQFICPEPLR
jgi:adenine deaminase